MSQQKFNKTIHWKSKNKLLKKKKKLKNKRIGNLSMYNFHVFKITLKSHLPKFLNFFICCTLQTNSWYEMPSSFIF